MKAGQTSKEAMILELKEEMNLILKNEEVELFKTFKYENAFKDVFLIKKDIDIDKLILEKDEVEKVKFLTMLEINDLINKGVVRKTNYDVIEEFPFLVENKH